MTSVKFTILALAKKIWPKVTAYALLGVLSALAAVIFNGYLPEEFGNFVGTETAGNILTILASSMLAVTTFSLSTMVSAYGAATSNVTPRATSLITEDKTTQNALSTFLVKQRKSSIKKELNYTAEKSQKKNTVKDMMQLWIILEL